MKTITIQAPYGGFITDYTDGNTRSLEGGANQYARSNGADVFRQGKVGHIAPAQVFNSGYVIDANSRFNSLARAVIVDVASANNDVIWLTGGFASTAPRRVRTRNDSDDAHDDVAAHAGHNFTVVPSTNYWGEDIVTYRSKVGGTLTNNAFYSWNDSVDGDIGRMKLGVASVSDGTTSFISTVPAGSGVLIAGVPHLMAEGADKILYITNGQYLASYDGNTGNDGTFNNDALDLGNGWVLVDTRKYRKFIAALANKIPEGTYANYTFSSESKVVFWNGTDPSYQFEFGPAEGMDDFFASALFVAQGELYAWSRGRNNTTKLKQFDGRDKFVTVAEYPSSIIGTPPLPRSIEYHEDFIKWLPSDGTSNFLISYGPLSSQTRGIHIPSVVRSGTAVSVANGTSMGLLKNINQNKLYIGSNFSTANDLGYRPAFLDGTGGYMTSRDFRTKLYTAWDDGSPLENASIKKIKVWFSQKGSVLLSLFKDYDAISVSTDGIDRLDWQLSSTTSNLYESIGNLLTEINAFYMNLRFNHSNVTDTAAIIRKVVLYGDNTDKV